MLNEKQANVLTEEELKEMAEVMETIEGYINSGMEIITAIGMVTKMKEVITSHRALNSRNAKLVHENDELMAENFKLKVELNRVKSHLEGVINPKRFVMLDCPWMLQVINSALEELNHE